MTNNLPDLMPDRTIDEFAQEILETHEFGTPEHFLVNFYLTRTPRPLENSGGDVELLDRAFRNGIQNALQTPGTRQDMINCLVSVCEQMLEFKRGLLASHTPDKAQQPTSPKGQGDTFQVVSVSCTCGNTIRVENTQPPEKADMHCKDCCCARSWKTLGVTEYTGKSISEHIEELRTKADARTDKVDAIPGLGEAIELMKTADVKMHHRPAINTLIEAAKRYAVRMEGGE